MGKTSSKVKDRYNAKAYDEIKIRVPKGQKQTVESYAATQGTSVNGLINLLLRNAMNLNEADWKRRTTSPSADEDLP